MYISNGRNATSKTKTEAISKIDNKPLKKKPIPKIKPIPRIDYKPLKKRTKKK
jgi:hypothetical protein